MDNGLETLSLSAPFSRTLSDQVAGQLRQAILMGRLKPGQRIVEHEIAQAMAISRGPVRDALRILQNERLVVQYPHRGAFVAWLTLRDAEEIYSIRRELEMLAVEFAVKYATDEQRERFLRPLVAGEIRSCFSMTEPETSGSNPVLLATTAVTDGDDYVINGQKWFTSSADGAAFAIVMAVTNPDAPPHQRASMIIVPTDTPGFNLVRNVSVMGHSGSGHASHAEVIYQSCRVPRTNLLGPEGSGFLIAQDRLGPGRIHHCMRWLGIAGRAFDMMCTRANERVVDIDGGTLADKQVIQHWAAEMEAEIRGARLQTLHAAWMIDQHGASAARDEISAIKFEVANTMLKSVDRAIQVHGALGVTDDTILAYWYRHERAARIYDGADEVHKTSLGRRILRRYARAAEAR